MPPNPGLGFAGIIIIAQCKEVKEVAEAEKKERARCEVTGTWLALSGMG